MRFFYHNDMVKGLSDNKRGNFVSTKTNKVKNEFYLMRQDNSIYKFSINIYFSSIGQDKSKLQLTHHNIL